MNTSFLVSTMTPIILPGIPIMLGMTFLSRVSKILHPHEYEEIYIGSADAKGLDAGVAKLVELAGH